MTGVSGGGIRGRTQRGPVSVGPPTNPTPPQWPAGHGIVVWSSPRSSVFCGWSVPVLIYTYLSLSLSKFIPLKSNQASPFNDSLFIASSLRNIKKKVHLNQVCGEREELWWFHRRGSDTLPQQNDHGYRSNDNDNNQIRSTATAAGAGHGSE